MSNVIVLAQCGKGKGLAQDGLIRIANGTPINKVILEKKHLLEFTRLLNVELVKAGINAIEPEGSIKGRILSNKESDRLHNLPDGNMNDAWQLYKEALPARNGTLVAFREGGAKLGDLVEYKDSRTEISYRLEVPIDYRNEKDAILAVNHGFLADGRELIIPRKKGSTITYDIVDKGSIRLFRHFPAGNGYYHAGNDFGIPLGEEISLPGNDVRVLDRLPKYVGLLVFGHYSAHPHLSVCTLPPSLPAGGIISLEATAKQ
ncbi:MAG: hypothetical protein WC861_00275 [Candidatus Micrarchaeia archaeon]|jgi:hypothetical protein